VPAADAAYGIHIDTNTPQGLRAKQTMDMVNSEWPIGTVGVRTMAVPQQVNPITAAMGNLWWDRPVSVSGLDIGAGIATLHVLTPYGAAQDIELRTNDAGLVDRFAVTLQPPVIKKWADIDTVLTKSGARYSYQVSKVTDGKCSTVAGINTEPPTAVTVSSAAFRSLTANVHSGPLVGASSSARRPCTTPIAGPALDVRKNPG